MKINNISAIILFFMFLLSCEHKETDPKSHFKHTFNIKAKKLNIDTYKLNSFGRMIPFEDHQCIIKENYLGQSLLDKIYYTKDSLQSFAELGEGPDENIMPRLMQKKDKSSVNIFDLQKKQIITKDLSKNISDITKLKCMPLSIIQTKYGYIVSGLLDKNENDNNRYAILNNEGEFIKSFGDFPKDGNESGIKSKALAYQGWMVYNPLLDRFASVTSSGAIFELYQISATPNLIKSYHDIYPIYINDSSPGINSIKHGQENVIGYTDIYATDKYIYTLYSGKKLAQHNNEGMMNAMLSNNILINNWNGECVCRLFFDKKLFNICITDNNKELIAIGWEKDFCLYSFDLSKVL